MTMSEIKETTSPVELLKAAVTGKADPKPEAEVSTADVPAPKRLSLPQVPRFAHHRLAIPGAALALGAVLGGGVVAMTRSASLPSDAVQALSTTLDAGRTETARLGSDIAQLHQVLADLRASTDTARKEASTRSAALGERLAQLDKSLSAKTAALGERMEQVEREQNARIAGLATQIDRRAAVTPAARTEPTQTGSLADVPRSAEKVAETKATDGKAPDVKLADAKPVDVKPKTPVSDKPPVIEGWALRDIFEGAAIVENRRRRLVEVAPGDMLPGVGRVESVERRGREWVVVTRQGIVTSQPW